jgi:hypothetical protein
MPVASGKGGVMKATGESGSMIAPGLQASPGAGYMDTLVGQGIHAPGYETMALRDMMPMADVRQLQGASGLVDEALGMSAPRALEALDSPFRGSRFLEAELAKTLEELGQFSPVQRWLARRMPG